MNELLLIWMLLGFQAPTEVPVTDYTIEARLIPEQRMVTGSQKLIYTNQSPDIITDLQFHAYLNATLNNRSTYNDRQLQAVHGPWGFLHIEQAQIEGQDVLSDLRWVQAEDATEEDRTVFSLPLAQPLLPGDSVEVSMTFAGRLPEAWDRVGYLDEYYFVGQWFPKIGVWETTGFRDRKEPGWNCHAFHTYTEFFANFGNYQVTLDVPEAYQVGATGKMISQEGTRRTYRAERVIDFAWVAWPHYKEVRRTFTSDDLSDACHAAMTAQSLKIEDVVSGPVEMILLLDPEHAAQEERHFQTMVQSLSWFGLWLGPYPYDTITMVDIPSGAQFSGGMEYPSLITLGSSYHNPKGDTELEDLIIHEFGHQYFYGLMATNEFEEAWMDEGYTNYITAKLVDQVLRPDANYRTFQPMAQTDWPAYMGFSRYYPVMRRLGLRYPNQYHLLGMERATITESNRIRVLREKGRDAIDTPAWRYHPRGYAVNAYPKPALMLNQLEREIGEVKMAELMRAYATRWRFKHPTGSDFVALTNEIVGQDMNWFFEAMLHGTGPLDFEASYIESIPRGSTEGYQLDGTRPVVASNPEPKSYWENRVMVRKHGARNYPVDILVGLANGEEVRTRWQGDESWYEFNFDAESRVSWVALDPDNKIIIDANRANNSRMRGGGETTTSRWSARMIIWAQNLLQTIAGGL